MATVTVIYTTPADVTQGQLDRVTDLIRAAVDLVTIAAAASPPATVPEPLTVTVLDEQGQEQIAVAPVIDPGFSPMAPLGPPPGWTPPEEPDPDPEPV